MNSLPPLPNELKFISPYLQRAQELQQREPVIAYYCNYYAAKLAIEKGTKEKGESQNFLFKLLDVLEKEKKKFSNNEAVTNDIVGEAFVENFAIKIFLNADNIDRAGKATKQTAMTFLASSIFLELLKIFGELSPEVENKIKYAKWKAAHIIKALRDGQRPIAGPPGGDPTSQESTYVDNVNTNAGQRAPDNNKDDINNNIGFVPGIDQFPSAPLSNVSTTGPPLPPKSNGEFNKINLNSNNNNNSNNDDNNNNNNELLTSNMSFDKFNNQQPIIQSDFSEQLNSNAPAFYEQNPQYHHNNQQQQQLHQTSPSLPQSNVNGYNNDLFYQQPVVSNLSHIPQQTSQQSQTFQAIQPFNYIQSITPTPTATSSIQPHHSQLSQQQRTPNATTSTGQQQQPTRSTLNLKSNNHFEIDPNTVATAQKYCKWAVSALNYNDVKTAIENIDKAKALLESYNN